MMLGSLCGASQLETEAVVYVGTMPQLAFPGSSVGKESACSAGDVGDSGSFPGSGRSPGGGHGNPLQCFCLENCMDRGSWRATVHRVAKSQTQLKRPTKIEILG